MDAKVAELQKQLQVLSHQLLLTRSTLTRPRLLQRKHRTADQLFYASDGNRDNKLNFEEFSRGVAMMGIRPIPLPSEMRALFDSYDKNGDGWIQWNELSK